MFKLIFLKSLSRICSGNPSDPFSLVFTPASDTYTCTGTSQCALESCECMADLGIKLARSLVDNNFQLDANNNNVTQDRCVRGIGNGQFTDACCGSSPSWKPYNSNTHQCSSGNIISL